MNESEFKKYKKNLKVREKSSSKTLWLVMYTCLIYLLFGSFNVCGKIFLTCAYLYSFSDFNDESFDLDYSALNLADFQWFLFSLAGPISLQLLPDIVGRMQFKFILLIASLGPIIFLTPAPYVANCKGSSETICSTGLIYFYSFLVSIIAGLFQSILLFVMLFYLSNLAKSQEKVIYYSAFFFMQQVIFISHSLQWLLGSLIGQLFLSLNKKDDNDINNKKMIEKTFCYLMLFQLSVSLMYLTLPEKEGRYQQFCKTILEYFNQKSLKQSKIDLNGNEGIRALLLRSNDINLSDEESDTFKENEYQKKSGKDNRNSESELHLFRSSMLNNNSTKSIMTLQCFSIEEQNLLELLERNNQCFNQQLSIDEYQQRGYFSKLYITWLKLKENQFQWFCFMICFLANIQSFLFIYFFPFFAYPGKKTLLFQATLVLEGYLYVGVGELFGSFGIGMLGDSKDKINALIFILYIFQFGCFTAWASYKFEYEILVLIFSCSTGFSDSALASTVISALTLKFPKLIYLVDLIYFIYSISFAISSIIYFSCNFGDQTYISLILLQLCGIVGLTSVYKINNQIEKKIIIVLQ